MCSFLFHDWVVVYVCSSSYHASHESSGLASLRRIHISQPRTSSLSFSGSKASGLNQNGAKSQETMTAQRDQHVRQYVPMPSGHEPSCISSSSPQSSSKPL